MIKENRIDKSIAIFLIFLIASLGINLPLIYAVPTTQALNYTPLKSSLKDKISVAVNGLLEKAGKLIPQISETRVETVEAQQQVGCCLLTEGGQFCRGRTTRDQCQEGFFFTGQQCGNFAQCALGTCIPRDGECQAGKVKFECIDSGGLWDPREPEQVEACQRGACVIAGIICQVLEKKVCEERARDLGFSPEDVRFIRGMTDEGEVTLLCLGEQRGTCELGGGLCDYTTRGDCDARGGENFREGVLPSQVTACAVNDECAFTGCGKLPGDENKRFCFNDQGSQEALSEDCGFPAGVCREEIGRGGEITSFCRSTACEFELKEKDGDGRKGEKNLVSGTSMCYNFYKDNNGKSTGLQHQILHCAQGEVLVEGLGVDRERICVKADERTATIIENKWQKCTECGQDGLLNDFGDAWAIIPFLGDILNNLISSSCDVPGSFGDRSSKRGNCKYDRNLPWGGIGSAVPKVNPGNTLQCKKCGVGGDALWNVCNTEECNALGDCDFSNRGVGDKFIGLAQMITAGIYFDFISCAFTGIFTGPGGFKKCLESKGKFWSKIVGREFKVWGIKAGEYKPEQAGIGDAYIFPHGIPSGFSKMQIGHIVTLALTLKYFASGAEKTFGGTCSAEIPRRGTDSCELCGGDDNDLRLCTKERCEILGACRAIPKDDGRGYHCIAAACDQREQQLPPEVTEMGAEFFSFENSIGSFSSSREGEGVITFIDIEQPLAWNTTHFELTVTTNTGATCRFATEPNQAFESMTDFADFGELNGEPFPTINKGVITAGTPGRENTIFIKCENACGIETPQGFDSYFVKYRLSDPPDFLPPFIERLDPQSGLIGENLGTIDVEINLNENGQCYFSKDFTTSNIPDMDPFTCQQNAKCFGANVNKCGFCTTPVDLRAGREVDAGELFAGSGFGLESEGIDTVRVSDFTFRCQDLEQNVAAPFNYTLIAIPGFNVSILMPEEGQDLFDPQPEILVDTSPRTTICRYSVDERKNFNDMQSVLEEERFAKIHDGFVREELSFGSHTLFIICEDFALQEVIESVSFTVSRDTSPPIIIRVFRQTTAAGVELLVIITDELSTCRYTHTGFDFAFEDGTAMPEDNSVEHSAIFSQQSYYVKCRDRFDNEMQKIVTPSS